MSVAVLLWSLTVTAVTSTASPATLVVEVAATPAAIRRGLQQRPALAPNQGMWFVLAHAQPARFWMREVTFPIDIVFVRADGRIDSIAHSVPPCTDDPCPIYESAEPVTYVLEAPAGWARARRVKPGARLRFDESTKTVTLIDTAWPTKTPAR